MPAILQDGLRPRVSTGMSQWEHTAESHPDAVYLTSAYPLHFAANAKGKGSLAILELDTALLEPKLLVADEDALALANGKSCPADWTLMQRLDYFRERMQDYPATESLRVLGTCAYLGTIPQAAIRRIVEITERDAVRLVIGGFDPVIAPVNYTFMGEQYEQSVRWLFGDDELCEFNPRLTLPPMQITTR